jgi:hypothetical protein
MLQNDPAQESENDETVGNNSLVCNLSLICGFLLYENQNDVCGKVFR